MTFILIVKQVYWYVYQISGERLQDHWSSGFKFLLFGKAKPWLEISSCPSQVKFVGGNLTLLEGCPQESGQLEIHQQVFDLIILSEIHNNEN